MKIFDTFLIYALLVPASLLSQGTWFTDYNAGLEEAKITGKNILLEIGTNQYGAPLFIYDEVWQDTIVQLELNNYIPVSVEITEFPALQDKFNLEFMPTIIVLDGDERILYKDSGRKDEFDIIGILNFLHYENKKINDLAMLYGDTFDKVGSIIYAENCLHQSMLAPDAMKRYYSNKSEDLLELIESNKNQLDDQLKQRLTILTYAQDIIAGFDLTKIKKLYKLGKKDLKGKNHSLLLYALIIGEEYDGDNDRAKEIYQELQKRVQKDPQAVEYSYNLMKMFDLE